MVDYYYEYGPGFYYQTQGLSPTAVEAEVLKITKGKRSGTEEEYRQAASRVPGYNASQAERDRAAIRAEFEAREREQSALKGSFMGREAQARVYGGTPQKQIVGIEAAKAAELQAARQETARRQSEQATTPTEALAIQRMLRSPTAQFASQEVAQRGYELASRYDRSFAPEQVRATLAPQYQAVSQNQNKPQSFFGRAPTEQTGIRPSFPTPTRPGSIAERAAFESRTRGFYTYGTVRRLEAISSRLQEGVESAIGYDERSSIPVRAAAGFASAFTGLPAFAGQVAGAGEAIIRYPSAALRGLPTGFKILSSQVAEQATTKPVEFASSLAGYVAIGKFQAKIPTIKAPTYREMFGGKGPSPFEGLIKTPTGTEAYRAMFGAPRGVSLKEPVGIEKLIPRAELPTYRETFGGKGETPKFSDISPKAPTYREIFGSGERVKLSTEIQPYIRPTLTGVKALVRSEEAILAPRRAKYEPGSVDISKALKRGTEGGFTGSIESFGSKGYKPTGYKAPKTPEIIPIVKRVEPMAMERLKIQPEQARPKLRPVMELERPIVLKGLEQGIMTKTEFMAQQKTGLRATPLSQLRTLPEKIPIKIIPYSQVPQAKPKISVKTRPIISTLKIVSTQPLTKVRVKQRVSTLPTVRTIPQFATKTLTKIKPTIKALVKTMPLTKVQTQLQTKTITELRTKTITEPKQQRTKEPSEFKKQSAIFRGSRKYTTKLGGKTLDQLSAELKGKKKTRRKRRK